ESISEALSGFQRKDENSSGYEIFTVKGWDYPALIETYEKVSQLVRKEHVPALIHVKELTQPQGHSTSGSHERYKSKDRLAWEKENDCILAMRNWMISQEISTDEDLKDLEKAAKKEAREGKKAAWKAFIGKQKEDKKELLEILENLQKESQTPKSIAEIRKELKAIKNTFKHQLLTAARKALRKTYKENSNSRKELQNWIKTYTEKNQPEYSSHLHSNSEWNAKNIEEVLPTYDEDAEQVDGRIIIRDNFDKIFEKNSKVDRKSTRLNSSHVSISYAVFCLKKKNH